MGSVFVVLKIYKRILEMRLWEIVEPKLEEEQGASRPLRQTQDHIYSIRTLCEIFTDKGKDVYFVFIDLKAAFDLIPMQAIWEALAEKCSRSSDSSYQEYVHRSERSSEN
jgi:hypothetical protein